MNKKTENKGYLLGVDTGSSKTHALITDFSGNVMGLAESGCGNYETIGEDKFVTTLNHVVEKVSAQSGIEKNQIQGMGFGICGYDWPSEAPVMIAAIESLGIRCPYSFVNDVMIGLIAGTSCGWGVAVDAGTGNNVRGRDNAGIIGRITGNSARFGELGGAAELVWRGMIEVIYAWTKRRPPTKITQLFMDFTKSETEQGLIEGLAMGKFSLPPTLAKDIFHLAEAGDTGAQEVVNFTARELALNVNAVIKQLNFQELTFEIVLIGSVFKAGEIYLNPFRTVIRNFAPKAQFVKLNVPPVVGGVLLAAETIQLDPFALRPNLMRSIQGQFI